MPATAHHSHPTPAATAAPAVVALLLLLLGAMVAEDVAAEPTDAGYLAKVWSKRYSEVRHAWTDAAIAGAVQDFRRLGALDLRLNHPDVAPSGR